MQGSPDEQERTAAPALRRGGPLTAVRDAFGPPDPTMSWRAKAVAFTVAGLLAFGPALAVRAGVS